MVGRGSQKEVGVGLEEEDGGDAGDDGGGKKERQG